MDKDWFGSSTQNYIVKKKPINLLRPLPSSGFKKNLGLGFDIVNNSKWNGSGPLQETCMLAKDYMNIKEPSMTRLAII